MSDASINRALAAAQLAKEQQNKEQKRPSQTIINPKATTMINEALSAKIAEKAQAVQATRQQAGEHKVESEKPEPTQMEIPMEAPKPTPPKPQSVYLNKSANTNSKAGQKAPAIITGPGDNYKEQGDDRFTKVELSIAGTTHRINCPASDVMNINRVAEQISEALRELRRAVRGKSPSNEELLVLHCLDLYDQLREANSERDQVLAEANRAEALIDKILKDANNIGSIL